MEFYSDSDEDTEVDQLDIRRLNDALNSEPGGGSSQTSQCSTTISRLSSQISESSQLTKISAAMALNKVADEKLRHLEKILLNRLKECEHKLNELYKCAPVTEREENFRYLTLGRPFFRDKSNFPAPDNDDTKVMRNSQMYDFSEIVSVSGWTAKDKTEFINEMHKISKEVRKETLNSKIAALRRKKKSDSDKKIQKEIAALSEEICEVNNMSLADLALPVDEEYDWEVLANRLNRRHTPHEYESLWKLFFHPSINKNTWLRNEHLALQNIASDNFFEGWDDIAKQLNTNRTGYQCFVYFRTNMITAYTGKKWTEEEIEYLKRLIDYYKEDNYIPWGKVAGAMENRTKVQIYNKYLRLIENRKGRFLPEEDAVILNCYKEFGPQFKKMLNYLPGRSINQIKTRFIVLNKMKISSVWTVQEDRQLIALMANQDQNFHFSELIKYFPGKDRVNIRTRYVTLTRWMKKFPNLDISRAPRRGARRLLHGKADASLHKAVENLKNRMQNEVNNKNNSKISKDSKESDIDDAITTIFYTEIVEEEVETMEDDNLSEAIEHIDTPQDELNATNIKKLLIFLNAYLNKEKFLNSTYRDTYPSLLNSDETSRTKVKSYSRKKNVQNTNTGEGLDVWGENPLGTSTYVLPPHYATITGCRVLTSLTYSKSNNVPDCLNMKMLMKRNALIKQHYTQLLERFNLLFLWPLLLSSEGPGYKTRAYPIVQKQIQEVKEYIEATVAQNAHNSIPIVYVPRTQKESKKQIKLINTIKTAPVIDLVCADDKEKVTFTEESIFKDFED